MRGYLGRASFTEAFHKRASTLRVSALVLSLGQTGIASVQGDICTQAGQKARLAGGYLE